jgi:hypothetical protein
MGEDQALYATRCGSVFREFLSPVRLGMMVVPGRPTWWRRLSLVFGVVLAASGWAAARVLNLQSIQESSSSRYVFSLEELPPLGGDAFPEPFDSQMAQIQGYGSRHPDTYAGAFLSGTEIFIGFTANAAQNLVALQEMVGSSAHLRAFKAEFSKEALQQLATRIDQDWERLQQLGIHISAVSVSEYRNRVEVSLTDISERAVAALRKAYGSGMLVFSEGTLMTA